MAVVRASRGAGLQAFVLGSILGVLWSTTSVCQAAVVRSVHSRTLADATEIVVDCEAAAAVHGRSRMRSDGGLFAVEIDNAVLAERAPRVVPVEDARVRGVIVRADAGSRSVRLLIDLASKVEARVQTLENPARLVVRLARPGRAAVAQAPAPSAPPKKPAPQRAPSAPVSAAATRSVNRAPASSSAGARVAEHPAVAAPARRPSRHAVVSRPLIVLDPGHGGKDPGAPAWYGGWEKDIVLDIAGRVADRLRLRLGVDVLMTRNEDVFVALSERRDLAKRWGADLFVSIHANASANTQASGIETYYHAGPVPVPVRAEARAARRLLREENGRAAGGGRARARAASASARGLPSSVRAESRRLACAVQAELVRNLGMRYEAIHDLGVKDGPFLVLEDIDVPSVLVEAAFLTHHEEALRIRSTVYREQVAEGIFRGIERYLAGQTDSGAL